MTWQPLATLGFFDLRPFSDASVNKDLRFRVTAAPLTPQPTFAHGRAMTFAARICWSIIIR
jgi:hypothetical protein